MQLLKIENSLVKWGQPHFKFHMSFWGHQKFGLMGSQIETKHILNVVRIIINLQHFKLGIEKLDHFILVV